MSPEAVTTCFAWHEAAWASLWARPEALHHALLITGPEGIGKSRFADAMAARLLCESPKGIHACGICSGCHWLAGGNHPDYRKVELESDEEPAEGEEEASVKPAKTTKAGKPKKPSTQIKIDQIRALEDFIYVGSHRNGRRVVIVEPAEALNPAAANALLKVLEEPPPNVYFLMVSSNWRRLLPTLRSRCRRIDLPLPETAVAVKWLKEQQLPKPELALSLAGGAPLKAISQEEKGGREGVEQLLAVIAGGPGDPISAAARWDAVIKGNPALSMEDLVDVLQKWLHDLLRTRQGVTPRFLTSLHKELQALAGRIDPGRVMRFNRELLRIRATARHPLNPQLFLEDIAARYVLAVSTPAVRKTS